MIASNQSAVNEGKNRFSTGGTLTTTDIQNTASYSASSASVGVGVGQVGKGRGICGVGMGVGRDSDTDLLLWNGLRLGRSPVRTGQW